MNREFLNGNILTFLDILNFRRGSGNQKLQIFVKTLIGQRKPLKFLLRFLNVFENLFEILSKHPMGIEFCCGMLSSNKHSLSNGLLCFKSFSFHIIRCCRHWSPWQGCVKHFALVLLRTNILAAKPLIRKKLYLKGVLYFQGYWKFRWKEKRVNCFRLVQD